MSLILQLETSSEVCSVAISENGTLISSAISDSNNNHSEVITLLIQNCLSNERIHLKDIDAVSVSGGPGSYTSLRVGVSTAKGICYTLDCPLIVLDSLQILAAGLNYGAVSLNDVIIPMIDARRMEVYTSIFDHQLNVIKPTEAIILESETFSELYNGRTLHLCGSGATKFVSNFASPNLKLHHITTSASYMTKLAGTAFLKKEFTDIAYYTPNYFKTPNISKAAKKYF